MMGWWYDGMVGWWYDGVMDELGDVDDV